MNLVLIGVNHKTAPLEVRERLAIPPARLGEAMARMVTHGDVEEGLILSTCNRVELIANCRNGGAGLPAFLAEFCGCEPGSFEPHLYEYRDREAVRHVFEVAASLDSMIVGEPQILGQVKEAYTTARQVGAVRAELDALFMRAFAVAKRVRTETSIGTSAVSVASAAVELAKEIFGTLAGKQVYVVGAGKMSELVARHLVEHGAGAIFVANRTHEHAVQLAAQFGGQAILFQDLYDTADRADIVISSTGAPHAIFRREHGERFLARRKNRPMFFIDIAVPRDVDPEMAKLDGLFVYNIDDLQSVVQSNAAGREREAERARAIIEEEIDKFQARLDTRQVAPTIVSLHEHLETIRQAEVERARGRLGKLSPEQELAIESLTRGIINKVLHTPVRALKSAARGTSGPTFIEVVQKIFNLAPGESANKSSEKTTYPEQEEKQVTAALRK
jgi:glutamyl-tRNA reductase